MGEVWNNISKKRGAEKLPWCTTPGTNQNCVSIFDNQVCIPCTPLPDNNPYVPNPLEPPPWLNPILPTPGSNDCSLPDSQPNYNDPVATKNCHKFRFLPQPCGSDWIEYCGGDCGVYPCWLKHPWLAFTDTLDGGMEYAVLPLTLAGVAAAFYFLR